MRLEGLQTRRPTGTPAHAFASLDRLGENRGFAVEMAVADDVLAVDEHVLCPPGARMMHETVRHVVHGLRHVKNGEVRPFPHLDRANLRRQSEGASAFEREPL